MKRLISYGIEHRHKRQHRRKSNDGIGDNNENGMVTMAASA